MPRCSSLSQPHDPDLSRMLVVYVATGLAFMLLPGTFVGVLNLMKIASAHAATAADASWVQAHGHAQLFGWLGTFILGIGYYAIPRLRLSRFSRAAAWTTYGLWTAGVAIRWAIGTWPWQWRILLAISAGLELQAVDIFAVSVFFSRPRAHDNAWRKSIVMITAAGMAMVAGVAMNAVESFIVAVNGDAPVFPAAFNQRYLVLVTWGFVVPFIWGFSSRWLPPLLGLRKTHNAMLMPALITLFIGTGIALAGFPAIGSAVLAIAAAMYIYALRLFEESEKPPKIRRLFIRLAYSWSIIAALLSMIEGRGFAGASRHALTVGFFAATAFTIGSRVLPAFFNVRRLWSTRVMELSLLLLNIGCLLRVTSQIAAYEQFSTHAWGTLGFSALIEMTAVTLFAANMVLTITGVESLRQYKNRGTDGDGATGRSGIERFSALPR